MTPPPGPDRLHRAEAALVLALAGVFLLLGALFLAAPGVGAALFGLPAPGAEALAWVRTVALRDPALGLYLAGLWWLGSRRGLGVVLAATVVIPLGDMLMVFLWHGGATPWLLPHAASALATAGLGAGCCAGREGGLPARKRWRILHMKGGSPGGEALPMVAAENENRRETSPGHARPPPRRPAWLRHSTPSAAPSGRAGARPCAAGPCAAPAVPPRVPDNPRDTARA
ncbi:DUF4267 domain-containing protein [Teichococcus aestuarii]|uniref:DUF4267 domain-containing protein n=1 Tax=Teichococcus aestuarii TaxID=568898 RepID=UPI0036112019